MQAQQPWRATGLSVALFLTFLLIWHVATRPAEGTVTVDPAYAALVGSAAASGSATPFPGPAEVGAKLWQHLRDPFYDRGPNDKGIGVQLAYSVARVLTGFLLAALVAIPLGFLVGMSRMVHRAVDPFIQVLKPISPLAWMPLALYTIKDANTSAIFVIFICSLWPMLANTAFGVASVRQDWLNVARTLEVSRLRTALRVILPAAAPTIMTGMRISVGIAWLVIVAAEMLTGGVGIGFFIWDAWNSSRLPDIVVALVYIGVIGFVLDRLVAAIAGIITRGTSVS